MNQFEPTGFIKAAHEILVQEYSHLPANVVAAYVDDALAETMTHIKATLFFYQGPLTIRDEVYTATIMPNNGDGRRLAADTSKHPYRVYLRSDRTQHYAAYILHLSDDERANFSDIAAERISQEIGKPMNRHMTWNWRNQKPSSYRGGFTVDAATDLVNRFLECFGAKLGEVADINRHNKKYLIADLRDDVFERRWKLQQSIKDSLDFPVENFMKTYEEERLAVYNALLVAQKPQESWDNIWKFRYNAATVTDQAGHEPRAWLTKNTVDFWRAIDSGKTAIEAIAKIFKIPPHVARQVLQKEDSLNGMGGVSYHFFGRRSMNIPLWRLFALQPNLYTPQSHDEWKSFNDIAKLIENYLSAGCDPNAQLEHQIAKGMKDVWKGYRGVKNWCEVARELTVGTGEFRVNTLQTYVQDMISSMFDKMVLPVIARADSAAPLPCGLLPKVYAQIGMHYNTQQIVAGARYWHDNLPLFTHTLASTQTASEGLASWPTLTGTIDSVDVPGGIVITPLASNEALKKEYEAFYHCVQDYAWRCMEGTSFLFSLSDRNGTKLSTLELVQVGSTKLFEVRIQQNKAYINSPAPAEAKLAAEWLVAQINNNPNFQKNINAMLDYQKRRREQSSAESQNELHQRIGYDFNDLEKCEAVRRHFTPCLPKWMREQIKSVDDFLRVTGVDIILRDHGYLPPIPKQASRAPAPRSAPGHNR